ncbi:class I SAM-dependent methyltransferase [Geobacter hydrogenophilus]|uniref:SAM-dependent methyltransferase n=1 Tax=Geobacter hydrogenophilus TaxID=40983 RepID=A0A9W6FXG0_9BACT|nr:class I SAM-dependent methyltransferase [Geobacter hydrogenophilus]MBT0895224.1 class I SAM-dependent methyltransferase [Geobacter hydrogenophilus]GLI36593.1 SAM-dependent methyltransferase [Geobacter hydrogenophilus]
MSVFESYSRYYDLLYRDKDYAGEAAYVDRLIRSYQPGAVSLLDLGCGTGRHSRLLADKGYKVHGVDASREMLHVAHEKSTGGTAAFSHGDIRDLRLDEKFDAAVALFHVMSYQLTNDDLRASFESICRCLNPGGVFIFDFWYGPAVLTDRPTVRVKRLQDEAVELTRIAEPQMFAAENRVDVNYHVILRDKENGRIEEIFETHSMRYLFSPEVSIFSELTGFSVEDSFEYLTGKVLGYDTWNGCAVVRKR